MSFDQSSVSLSKLNRISQHLPLATLCKSIAISGIVLFVCYAFALNNCHKRSQNLFFELKWSSSSSSPSLEASETPTNINHIMFVIVGNMKTWKNRKPYIEAWWRPNVTMGHIYMEEDPKQDFVPWPKSSPPFRVNRESTKSKSLMRVASETNIRTYQSISDSFKTRSKDVRWYVIADDDTLFFVDNLVEVLRKYDYNQFYYIGMNSESLWSDAVFSFDMGFGGAGYALSYHVVEALVSSFEDCMERYPSLSSDHYSVTPSYTSDHLAFLCLSDLGVDLTHEKGIHQVDLHGDISGLLSAHPQSPVISLHHFDVIEPIFPSMTRQNSVNHLMRVGKIDQSRLLQQTICYRRETNWSVTVSWGYSVHIYQSIFPRSFLRRPIETFRPWKNVRPPLYTFNTRQVTRNPCEAPHVFFFHDIDVKVRGDYGVVTRYKVRSQQNPPPCSSTGNHSVNLITEVRASVVTIHKEVGRIECCDVDYVAGTNVMDIKLRPCMRDEIIA